MMMTDWLINQRNKTNTTCCVGSLVVLAGVHNVYFKEALRVDQDQISLQPY